MNLIEPILRHARMQPHVAALIEREQTIAYGELADRVLRTADHLAKLGVVRGDQVGLCLKDDSQHVVALLAVAHMGATAVQIDARSRPTERASVVGAFPLRLALVTPESEKGINCPKVVFDAAWHSAIAAADRNVAAAQDWHTPMAVLASSGTTGLPKFTIATHFEYHFHMVSYLEVMPPRRHRYLSTLPLYFSAGRVACLSHLLRGDTLIIHPALSSPEEFVESVLRYRITTTFVVPSMLRQLLSMAGDHRPLLPEIDLLISGGAPLFADEKLEVVQKVTPQFCELYGTAAMGPMAALRPEEIRERPTSVGRPFSFIDVEIVNDSDGPLDPGATGHLRCRGPGLTLPITNASKAHSKDFRDGWYYPGELAAIDELGYIFLQGRASEVIFRGGAKIFPSEVEAVLQAHEGVAEAAVVGRALSNNEQEPVAYVVARHPVTPGELLAHCRTRLTAFKVPREIYIVADLPRNSSGKVDKRALAN
jgi:acyl-CoA synthetase (AMP-forming)/AMP-acid ligase II